MKTKIDTIHAPKAIGPYSQGIAYTASKTLYVSGQTPIDPVTSKIPEFIEEQTEKCLLNIKAILEEAGSSMDDVMKTTVYLTNMEDFAKMNEIYAKFFKEPFPARVTVEVSRLPKNVDIEIDAVATF
ncbi:MAG: RidA family protein [Clostridiaceae bacterium]